MQRRSKGTNNEKSGKKKAIIIKRNKFDKFCKAGCRLNKWFITVEKWKEAEHQQNLEGAQGPARRGPVLPAILVQSTKNLTSTPACSLSSWLCNHRARLVSDKMHVLLIAQGRIRNSQLTALFQQINRLQALPINWSDNSGKVYP